MRNIVKLIFILCLCFGLLAMVGCGEKTPAADTTEDTTVPAESTGDATAPEETTTEKPVNIVEDPLDNGEGDPLDAMETTASEDNKPGIDIDVDDDGDAGNSETTPTENNGNNSGSTDSTTKPAGDDDDDFSVDFGDLLGG